MSLRSALILCHFGLALLLAAPAWAATSVPPSIAAGIERARAATAGAALDEAVARDANAALDEALAFDTRASSAVEAMQSLREATRGAEREQPALERALAEDPLKGFRSWRQQLPVEADEERLEGMLASERTELVRLRAAVTELREAQSTPASASLADLERDAELQLQMDAIVRRIAAGPQIAEQAPPALARARIVRSEGELRALSAELALRQLERETASVRRAHGDLRLRLAQRELAEREQRVEILQGLISGRQDGVLEALIARQQAQAEEFADAEPLLRVAADDTLALARQLADTTRALNALRSGEQTRQQAREQVAAALRNTQARLALEGQDEALGLILVSERRRLTSPDVVARRLNQTRVALARARLQQIGLGDMRAQFSDLEAAVANAVGSAELDGEEESAGLRVALYRLYGDRAEMLPRLDSTLQRYLSALEQSEATLRAHLADARALRDLLDQRMLWIRSHAAVDGAWFGRLAAGWADLLKPSRFVTSFELASRRIAEAPAVPLLVILLAVSLLRVRLLAGEWTDAVAPPLRRPAEDRYLNTAKALLIAIAAALPWALLAWGAGYVLRAAGEPGRFSDSLGRALIALSAGLFLLEFLRLLVIERGLAHLHFRWMRARREAIAKALPWARAVLLPMQFLIVLAFARNQDLAIDTAGRTLLLGFCGVGAYALWRLLAPGALWTTRGGPPEPRRKRQALRFALPLFLTGLAIVILNGFVYSGMVIIQSLWATLWTLVGIGVLHGLLSRWFLLGERRLALKRLEARREASQQEERSSASDEGAAEVADESLALETVNAQTGRLLRALTIGLAAGWLLWVWSDILPALARLDEVVMWSVASKAADGSAITEAVSLKAVLFGVLALMLTVISARNLPGLLELGLLSRTGIDVATRYAINALSRYAIVIIGCVIGFGLLGLRWSQLQWMAAALTVGLGFGLQEIFANFVSGLILLSERPFRVGDVITIGDQTGTVTRISTRATTLLDFDGKEVVVPNKTFITERLVNWTLSDTRTRVMIKVGVAYGSDTRRVHQLLQQVAQEHPLVLADPAPRSWFMAFGASSLDFELRVFVNAMADRLPVLNEINCRIAEVFAENDIAIAFPQLDLHVRDLPAGMRGDVPPDTVPAG